MAWATLEARRVPGWTQDRVQRLQDRRVRALVSWAYQTVPFYKEAIETRGLHPEDFRTHDDLERLPIIEPEWVQDDPERFTSNAHGPGRRWGFHTSGSNTGLRRVIYQDNGSLLRAAAYDAARSGLIISRLADERWAAVIMRTLAGDEGSVARRLLGRVAGASDEHRRLSIFPADFTSPTARSLRGEQTLFPPHADHHWHLSPLESVESAGETMRQVRPRVVFSFGSYADQFFRWLSEEGPAIPVPRVWAYTGDVVSPQTVDLAARFGCRLYSIYSTTDAGPIGFQCERREGLHLNIDRCVVHIVDGAGQRVQSGQSGELVVTALDNRAMVLVNLRIGDIGELASTGCPCGRSLPVLARLEGRRSETIALADGRRLSSLMAEGLLRVELRRARKVQIVELANGGLLLRIVPFAGVDQAKMREELLERGREVFGKATRVEIGFVSDIDSTELGKARRVVRAVELAGDVSGTQELRSEPARAPSGPRSANLDAAYWDGVVTSWDPTPAHRQWREHSDTLNAALVQDWLDPGLQSVLKTDLFDEALGVGLFPELAVHAKQVVGVDISPAAVQAASDRYPELQASVANVLTLPFDDGAFDAIVSNSTLDHFGSDEMLRAGLAELVRITRPGGQLIITLDNRTNPAVAARTTLPFWLMRRVKAVPYYVGVTHGARWLGGVLGELGVEVTDTRWIMHCPPQLWAQWSARRAGGTSRDRLKQALRVEALSRLPTRHVTGHFVCVQARRHPPGPTPSN